MIIVFGGEKGGTGKSTMAVIQTALRASQGRDVLLVDCDTQLSAQKWCALRMQEKVQPAITCVSLYGESIADQVRAMAPKYDDIIIDTRGADSVEFRAALLVADRLVTPTRPAQFDIFTLATNDSIVGKSRMYNPKLKASILINEAPTAVNSPEAADLREACTELNYYTVLDTEIKYRKAYQRVGSGRSVHEVPKADEKAVAEVTAAALEIWK